MSDFLNKQLVEASAQGLLDQVRKALASGADVGYCDNWPLQCAASGGHLAVVKALITAGADINAGRTVTRAIRAGQGKTLRYLVSSGAEICNLKFDEKTSFADLDVECVAFLDREGIFELNSDPQRHCYKTVLSNLGYSALVEANTETFLYAVARGADAQRLTRAALPWLLDAEVAYAGKKSLIERIHAANIAAGLSGVPYEDFKELLGQRQDFSQPSFMSKVFEDWLLGRFDEMTDDEVRNYESELETRVENYHEWLGSRRFE